MLFSWRCIKTHYLAWPAWLLPSRDRAIAASKVQTRCTLCTYDRSGGIVLKSELSLAQKQRLLLSQQQWVRGGLGREAFPAGASVCCIFPLVAWHVYKPRGVWMLAVAVALAIFPKDADATRRYSKRSATQQWRHNKISSNTAAVAENGQYYETHDEWSWVERACIQEDDERASPTSLCGANTQHDDGRKIQLILCLCRILFTTYVNNK